MLQVVPFAGTWLHASLLDGHMLTALQAEESLPRQGFHVWQTAVLCLQPFNCSWSFTVVTLQANLCETRMCSVEAALYLRVPLMLAGRGVPAPQEALCLADSSAMPAASGCSFAPEASH